MSGVNSNPYFFDNETSDDIDHNNFSTYGSEDTKFVLFSNGEVVRCHRIPGMNSFNIISYHRREHLKSTYDDGYSSEELSFLTSYNRKKRNYENGIVGPQFKLSINKAVENAKKEAATAIANANKQAAINVANANKQAADAVANANIQAVAATDVANANKLATIAITNANKEAAAAITNANRQATEAVTNANNQVAAADKLAKKYENICRKAFGQ